MIAGLTSERRTESEKRVPLVGSIPLVGMVFRRTVTEDTQIALYVFITPRISRGLEFGELELASEAAQTEAAETQKKLVKKRTLFGWLRDFVRFW